MVNHTKPSPEPWHANGFFVIDADGLIVAEVVSENPIDVRVVSAAGELLKALNDALRLIDLQGQPRIREVMMGAVAKAEGR